ncbi:MAG: CRISPR-associated endonuclease Cas1 [Candidatus Pacearchaeota archaeon]|nr:CRISPR-associated endonuclease Cas1 [Candidatus Pacearchaeota archaeon]
MKLVINEFGAHLSKRENCFIVKIKDKKEEFSADNVDQILIASPSTITEGAVRLAMEKNVDIVYTYFNGKPFARIYPCTLGGTTLTRREQAKAYFDNRGANIVKKILESKLKNQLFLLRRLNKTRDNLFENEINLLITQINRLSSLEINNIDNLRETLLGYEGYAASLYFSCLNKIFLFNRRNPQSQDIFNISLNYGYGILYSEVEKACIIAGLDPYLGFLHMDRYGKPSMVLDLVEQFRPIVDKAIVMLFSQKRISDNDLEKVGEAISLTKSGRNKIINEVMQNLSYKVKFKNKHVNISNLILEQAREIVKYLLGQSEKYEPFIWRE